MNKSLQPNPSLAELFMSMLLIGLQSFGGGSSTFGLINQLAIQRGWLSQEEFVQTWALAQMAPGINLIKLTIMIGYRLRGWSGLLAAIAGLLLPSAAVTILMTAGFASIRNLPWIQALIKGILPAVIGVSLAMGIQMAHPMLQRAYREGAARLATHLFILASAALLIGIVRLSPVIILVLAGITAVGLFQLTPVDQPVSANHEDLG